MNFSLIQKTTPDCLWTQAGVVLKKKCYKDFACIGCPFEKAMARVCRNNEALKAKGVQPEGKKARFVYWTDRLVKMPMAKRACIHHMKGHIGFKNCTKAYHCIDCDFEQYFYDQFKVNTVIKPVNFDDIHGVSLPSGYYLHPGHTWIKIEDQGMVRMGIDDFAGRLLGKFDAVTVPLIGKKLSQGRPALTLSREGREVSFVSPVNGVITEVNAQVTSTPGLINDDPYTGGWIFMMYCPTLKQDLKQLMFMDSSKGFMEATVHRLYEFLEDASGIKAADGGTLVPDIYGNLPGISWDTLVKKFILQAP